MTWRCDGGKALPSLPGPCSVMDATAVAKALVAARQSGAALSELPAGMPADASIADGYAVQDAMMALPGAPLGAVVGWKVRLERAASVTERTDAARLQIGATNAAAQSAMGFGPFYGPLFASAQLADGASASLASLGASFKASEAEYAFIMRADLPPRATPYSEDEVWAAVEAVCPAIELASSRFAGAAPPAGVLADGAWNGCFVLGRRVPPADVVGGAAALAASGAALLVNGAEVAANTGANVLGNPLTAMVRTLSCATALRFHVSSALSCAARPRRRGWPTRCRPRSTRWPRSRL